MKEPTAVFSSSTWTKHPAITWSVREETVWNDKNSVGDREVGRLCVGIVFCFEFRMLVSTKVPLGC